MKEKKATKNHRFCVEQRFPIEEDGTRTKILKDGVRLNVPTFVICIFLASITVGPSVFGLASVKKITSTF